MAYSEMASAQRFQNKELITNKYTIYMTVKTRTTTCSTVLVTTSKFTALYNDGTFYNAKKEISKVENSIIHD